MKQALDGFTKADNSYNRRLIVSVEGPEKKGKTHFALTAPGPIALLNLDIGDEGVVDKFVAQKEIYKNDYMAKRKMEQADYQELWERLKTDYYNALDHPEIKTVIMDTATDSWDLCRLAILGRLQQVMPHDYVRPNSEFKEMIKTAYGSDKNVIFLHQVKDEWVASQSTGNQIRAGFSKIGYTVQVVVKMITTDIEDEGRLFAFKIMDCRHNPTVNGIELSGEACTFDQLAGLVFCAKGD